MSDLDHLGPIAESRTLSMSRSISVTASRCTRFVACRLCDEGETKVDRHGGAEMQMRDNQ